MRRCILLLMLFSFVAPLAADGLDEYKEDADNLYRTGSGAEEGAFTAISTSMLGWGIGLSLGIAILASVLHQSSSSHAHTTTSSTTGQ